MMFLSNILASVLNFLFWVVLDISLAGAMIGAIVGICILIYKYGHMGKKYAITKNHDEFNDASFQYTVSIIISSALAGLLWPLTLAAIAGALRVVLHARSQTPESTDKKND